MTKLYLTLILLSSTLTRAFIPSDQGDVLKLNKELREKLSAEQRNAECCRKKMQCCKQRLDPPDIEIRAILVRCPRISCNEGGNLNRQAKQPIIQQREEYLKNFQGFDEDEPLSNSEVNKCHKKLLVTMKIKNAGPTNCRNVFVVVDHVFDPLSSSTARLLNPYVIKIKQEPIMEMYKLRLQHVVNSEAKEVVYNKHCGNYTGCDTTSATPTCGVVKYNGKVVPYSTGFCCSCDAMVNSKRQPESGFSENVVGFTDPAAVLEHVQCPRHVRGNENMDHVNSDERTIDSMHEVLEPVVRQKENVNPSRNEEDVNGINVVLPEVIAEQKTSQDEPIDIEGIILGDQFNQNLFIREVRNEMEEEIPTGAKLMQKVEELEKLLNDQWELDTEAAEKILEKRQVVPSGNQRRGGQNCADRYTPPKLDPEKYHESTHCLRFSDLWYTVYQLQEPVLEHSFYVQVFEKHEDTEGNTRWRDLTKGKMIRMGIFNPFYKDEDEAVAFHYKSKVTKPDEAQSINYRNARLLIPEVTSKLDPAEYPEIKGGPPEYLVVQQNQVSMDGDQCNIAGVGYEAFFKQPNRCSVPRGTCLANQPRHLWLHDRQAERMGEPGCFFLKNYGNLPKVPMRQNASGQDLFLAIEYSGKHYGLMDMEIKADFNTVLLKYSPGRITEIYVDSTSIFSTILTVKVTNAGLISGMFYVGMTDCPLEMPAALNNIRSRPALIAPQHQHIFKLAINFELPVDRFHCSMEAFNGKNELVAVRRIRIQKFDRCICTWHCLCACLGSSEGLKCRPMSLDHYHAAGFQGAMPVATTMQKYTLVDEVISWTFYFVLFLMLTLLILGLAKAAVGYCYLPIGDWGLDLLLGLPRKMRSYYEPELCRRAVVYDDEGWPIHPDTKQRVRNMSQVTQFCMNLVFFYIYPMTILFIVLKRICCPYYVYEREEDSAYCRQSRAVTFAFTTNANKKFSVQDLLKKRFSESEYEKSEGIISFEDVSESEFDSTRCPPCPYRPDLKPSQT